MRRADVPIVETVGTDKLNDGRVKWNAGDAEMAARIADARLEIDALLAGGVTINDRSITNLKLALAMITADEIANATIIGLKIAAATIMGSHIGAATITAANIADATITGDKIANATINGAKIGNATITADQIAVGAIIATHILDASITGAKIASGAINGGHIADASITGGKIANGTIDGGNLQNLAVTAGKIANLTITASQIAKLTIEGGAAGNIATSTISRENIVARTITALEIAVDTITAAEIAAGTITASELAADSVTAAQILAGSISVDELAASAVTAVKIAAGAITADKLAANSVTADAILAGAVTAGKLAANSVTAANIVAGGITADKLTVRPGSNNLLRNSSFESGTFLNWLSSGNPTFQIIAPQGSDVCIHGGFLCKAALSGNTQSTQLASDAIWINRTLPFVLSAWLRRQYGGVSTRSYVRLHAYNISNVSLGVVYPSQASAGVSLKTGEFNVDAGELVWGRYGGVYPANALPVGTVYVRVEIIVSFFPDAACEVWIDAVQFEQGDMASAYSPFVDELLPGVISADMIRADAIDGKTITGATVRTHADGSGVTLTTADGVVTRAGSGAASKHTWKRANGSVAAELYNFDPDATTSQTTLTGVSPDGTKSATLGVIGENATGLDGPRITAAINLIDTLFRATSLGFDNYKDYRAVRDGTAFAGTIYCPLVVPLTSIDWDGDAKAAGSGPIYLPTSFGVPPGAKAIQARVSLQWATLGNANYFSLGPSGAHTSLFKRADNAGWQEYEGVINTDGADNIVYALVGTDLTTIHLRIMGYYL